METAIKREVVKKGLSATDVVLVAVLLAAGAVLRLITPPIFGITPNFIIGMYCMAIFLIRPKFLEVIFIGLVAAAVCHFTTKSMIPYINFISEPVAALVVFGMIKLPFKAMINKITLKPAIIALFGTLTSGLVYVAILKFLILFVKTPKNPALMGLFMVVIVTAAANTIIAQLIYYPVKMATGKKELE
ncbi:tryptophan transporter [Pseudobacteroides cellulosolvens]|uniref:Tryptophan transport protein n=1 Tax=Pseudobacteroides cellulosolvens ATCC 35603 = DSM 2933 TaxID=398512 RepID=A0A0L6JIS0_9FIRM|nr:tryptophan transporter [Pseudobacteroides cellulosolvens]KNY25593.1 hypothetical protein Bccel_0853 [Pseudobacteroides cellulosolvens ATCC 35603 = DSM 2933]